MGATHFKMKTMKHVARRNRNGVARARLQHDACDGDTWRAGTGQSDEGVNGPNFWAIGS